MYWILFQTWRIIFLIKQVFHRPIWQESLKQWYSEWLQATYISFHFKVATFLSAAYYLFCSAVHLTKMHAFYILYFFPHHLGTWLGKERFLEWSDILCPSPSKAPQSKLQVCNVISTIKWRNNPNMQNLSEQ